MLAPLSGWVDREVYGVFKVATATAAGLAVQIDATNTAPLSVSLYGNSFGSVVPASIVNAGDMELGYLLQPVTATGPTLLNVLSQVYDESIAAGGTAAILPPKQGALIGTDQFATGAATGAIKFDNTVTLGTLCGIASGTIRVKQAGDVARLKFLGQVAQRNLTLAAFQII